MRLLWAVEVYNEKRPNEKDYKPNNGKWCAWTDYAFETRREARKCMRDHKAQGCWTKVRIRKYVPSYPEISYRRRPIVVDNPDVTK